MADRRGDDTKNTSQHTDAGPDEGKVRTGPESSSSLTYSQEISSPDQDPEHPGRSLVTTHRDVIRQWAETRGTTPAGAEGTEHGDPLGVFFQLESPGREAA
ncbi:hypothetical protein [Raineyella fluvialis]|uniref:Uncharacterized protein n=1 Tax=Raineyella fluvialis TaxID=2662261 RepID=A0A5Q2FIS9_9ACTN|nr:hypothetical protein [Raineyella fluvialis]QGF24276.1 hypothetical protein Rai3103_12070 [Raineyella fluvialis]